MPVDPRLESLQRVRRLPRSDGMTDVLDATVADLLADPDPAKGEAGVAYPARYYEGLDVGSYVGQVGHATIDTDDLTIDDLRQGLLARPREEYLRTLRTSRIQGVDDVGDALGDDTSALHWIAAEVVDPRYRYVLLDGEWYELGDEYRRHVGRVVAEAFASRPTWRLPAWRDAPADDTGRITEAAYNEFVADRDESFLCLDRKLVRTEAHPKEFEVCDLLGPDNELVHVKKGDSRKGSSVLSRLFAQGLVAIESLLDKQAWNDFHDLSNSKVRSANAFDVRPQTLVYAIHRADKPLTPETLFTFAGSALVCAWVALTTYDIPLKIAVIP
ncbi:DUF6119 family protein [Qaidamihabitans albus]|uniref:DUF6119 family protein n=1 Tax=Qaidamihabitans albus TaxID=2795733 RepID=UPI0018F2340F|nr:DUF6119 family protein [Qaidamihabitans albus]